MPRGDVVLSTFRSCVAISTSGEIWIRGVLYGVGSDKVGAVITIIREGIGNGCCTGSPTIDNERRVSKIAGHAQIIITGVGCTIC